MPEHDPPRDEEPTASEEERPEHGEEHEAPGDEHADSGEQVDVQPPEPAMSRRAMLLMGGIPSVAVIVVLGVTLLVGGTGEDASPSPGRTPSDTAFSVVPPRPASTAPTSSTASASGSPRASASAVAVAPPVAVPQVTGQPSMTAVGRLAARRIPLGSVIRVPSSQPAGLVLRSHPQAGTVIRGGEQVTLYVSAGLGGSVTGDEITVPYFIGLTEQQARGSAAALGLRISVTGGTGGVIAQQPVPGATRPRGSTVLLTLG